MPIKILYLDDEPDICAIFLEIFESDDLIINTFTNAQEAIKAASKENYDLIFLDYRLSNTNGDSVAQAMPNEIPKYLLTGELNVTTNYNFKKVLLKPFNIPVIYEIIRNSLQQH